MSDMTVVSKYLEMCDRALLVGLKVTVDKKHLWYTISTLTGNEIGTATDISHADKFIHGYQWGKLA
jgi:hypothetical protein